MFTNLSSQIPKSQLNKIKILTSHNTVEDIMLSFFFPRDFKCLCS